MKKINSLQFSRISLIFLLLSIISITVSWVIIIFDTNLSPSVENEYLMHYSMYVYIIGSMLSFIGLFFDSNKTFSKNIVLSFVCAFVLFIFFQGMVLKSIQKRMREIQRQNQLNSFGTW